MSAGRLVPALLLSALVAPILGAAAADGAPRPEQIRFFETRIRPLLVENCFKCHTGEKRRGGLQLDSRNAMLTGGKSGPAIVPGKPDESLLIQAVNYVSPKMPPTGPLDDEQIGALTLWVRMGAPWPGADDAPPAASHVRAGISDESRRWWAFQPVRDAAPPDVQDAGWPRNDIDHFVLSRLERAGLSPAPEADRRTLIRRVYFDLVGMPPSPEDVEAFVTDSSPQAYEQLVDRLLDSPHYGERWAQHWLDLVRYAESDGYRQDAYRPHAWRYRDYVIRSLNDDKPYDRFLSEQIAGDEIDPDDPEALVATGYLRHWIYEYNQRDVRTQWDTILNDVTDTTADVFLAMGMGCARCHDHKFDPILQTDYFRLRAFFEPLLPRDETPLAAAAEQADYARRLAVWEEKTADIRRRIDEIETPYRQKAAEAAIEKFPPDIRPMLRRPAARRTALEQQLADLSFRQVLFEWANLKPNKEDQEELQALRKELAQYDDLKPEPLPVAYTVIDAGSEAPPTLIPGRKGDSIEPGILTILDSRPLPIEPPSGSSNSTGRRTALARWLADPENPLSTRVIVNRVWQYHFGAGLVATSSDFGRLGEPPSHPDLLDWLTKRFLENGWRLKPLHRLIVTSAVYRQSADHPQADRGMLKDPTNRLLWRGTVRRLDAEQIRDAMLAVTGRLDLAAGGPSVDASQPRRSIYVKVVRNGPDPLLDAFDRAEAITSTAQRNVTTTATQSLLMINGAWILRRAEEFAERSASSSQEREEFVRAAYRQAYGRQPAENELIEAVAFLREQAVRAGPAGDSEQAARADLCHVLLNSNEFLYVD